MTVFKAFTKVLWQCRVLVIIYTIMLIIFGVFNDQSDSPAAGFTASRPSIAVVNRDGVGDLSAGLAEYLADHCQIFELPAEAQEETLHDALFYRDISYILYIPSGYSEDFWAGRDPELEVQSIGDSGAALAETLVSRYLNTARACAAFDDDQQAILNQVSEVLARQTTVEITAGHDANALDRAVWFYNFASYSILAGCVYVICMVLASFQDQRIRLRTAVSGMPLRRFNIQLLLSNSLFALVFCLFYILLSLILIGAGMRTAQGLLLMLNALVFTVSALTLAFLIGNLVSDRNAIGGIVNVVALGSSFLCGAFVPMEWLPDSVLAIAHLLPAYWYIRTNEQLKTAPAVDIKLLRSVLPSMAAILGFSILFSILSLYVARRKRRG